jgi:uncharacterized protein YeaO (DUF488 family)
VSSDEIAGNLRLKRIYDPPDDDDGVRVLATRYWPRGVHKSAVDEYHSKLAPSRELINGYRKQYLSWDEFCRSYRRELDESHEAQHLLARLANLARTQVVTLMCFCPDEWDCHRTVLKQALIDANNGMKH